MKETLMQDKIYSVEKNNLERRISTNWWPTDDIKVIKMKDGTFSLGVDVDYYIAAGVRNTRTCRIFLDENNNPYIYIGENYDFTEENCSEKINLQRYGNGSVNCCVSGHPILYPVDGHPVPAKSVFKFSKSTQEEPTVRRYFSAYYRDIVLNQLGLSVILQYIEDPANQQVLAQRLQPASKEELDSLQKQIKTTMERYFKGDAQLYKVEDLLNVYDSVQKGLSLNGMIELDLPALESEYDKYNF